MKTWSIIKTKSRFLIIKYSVPTILIRIELLELKVWMFSFLSIRSSRPEMPCYRSSHRRCSVKKGVLRNFAKFTEKHLCQRVFFNKVAGRRPGTLLRKTLWRRCFPVNFAKFLRHLRTTDSAVKKVFLRKNFFIEKYPWCSLSSNKISDLMSKNLLKRDSSICVFLRI